MNLERQEKRWRKSAMKEKAIDKYKWNWKKVDYSAYMFILPVMIFFLSFVLSFAFVFIFFSVLV